jgi:hypothetical protein
MAVQIQEIEVSLIRVTGCIGPFDRIGHVSTLWRQGNSLQPAKEEQVLRDQPP